MHALYLQSVSEQYQPCQRRLSSLQGHAATSTSPTPRGNQENTEGDDRCDTQGVSQGAPEVLQAIRSLRTLKPGFKTSQSRHRG